MTIDCVAITCGGAVWAAERRLSTCRNAYADSQHVMFISLPNFPLLSCTGSISSDAIPISRLERMNGDVLSVNPDFFRSQP